MSSDPIKIALKGLSEGVRRVWGGGPHDKTVRKSVAFLTIVLNSTGQNLCDSQSIISRTFSCQKSAYRRACILEEFFLQEPGQSGRSIVEGKDAGSEDQPTLA